MSTGKRLAKRSIVGTKVVVLREDGLYYPGKLIYHYFTFLFIAYVNGVSNTLILILFCFSSL